MMAVTPTKTPPEEPPRWLPPSEREDMWERQMQEYREELRTYREELKRNPPPPSPPRTDYDRDDVASRAMLEGLQAAGETPAGHLFLFV